MEYLFAEPSYSGSYAIVFLCLILGGCAIAIPRFRKTDPFAKDKKKRRRKKK